jgi:hypothetical protein
VRQNRDILFALSQRRESDRDHVQTIIEIFTKGVVLDCPFEVAIRSGNNPHVHGDGFGPPTRSNSRSCRNRKSLVLQLRRDIADLIQKHSAAVGQFHFSLFELMRPSESAFLMPEQIALQKLFGKPDSAPRKQSS